MHHWWRWHKLSTFCEMRRDKKKTRPSTFLSKMLQCWKKIKDRFGYFSTLSNKIMIKLVRLVTGRDSQWHNERIFKYCLHMTWSKCSWTQPAGVFKATQYIWHADTKPTLINMQQCYQIIWPQIWWTEAVRLFPASCYCHCLLLLVRG